MNVVGGSPEERLLNLLAEGACQLDDSDSDGELSGEVFFLVAEDAGERREGGAARGGGGGGGGRTTTAMGRGEEEKRGDSSPVEEGFGSAN